MRKLSVISFLLLIIFNSSSSQDYQEKILSYRSEIKIHKDASMDVTETIRVTAAGYKIKRGIFRDFPTRYKDKYGNNYTVGLDILEIKKNGFAEEFHTERIEGGIRIYIGDEDVYLKPGIYTYRIYYKTNRQIGFFDDHDELYWNVTGNGWEFQIDEASAVITLPEYISSSELKFYGYTGPSGSAAANLTSSSPNPGKAEYRSISPLAQYEGLTVVLEFPKKVVNEPSGGEKFGYFLSDNKDGIIGIAGLLIIFVYYFSTWKRIGKDPAKSTVIPLYQPPDNLSPAAVRFLSRMGFDNKTFASALINMAVKGYLTIKEENDEFILIKKNKNSAALSPDEKKISQKLIFTKNKITDDQVQSALSELKKHTSSGSFIKRKITTIIASAIESRTLKQRTAEDEAPEIKLSNKNHKIFSDAVQALKKELKNSYEKTYFLTNRKFFVIGAVLSLLFLIAAFLFGEAAGIFILVWVTIWTTCISFLVITVFKTWQNVFSGKKLKPALIGGALFITLFSVPFILGEFAGLYFLYSLTSPLMILILGVMVFLNILFYNLLKAPTLLGRIILDKIEGFRNYLSFAEKERLNYITPVEETPEIFEKYLPYALALDVEQEWAERFSSVIDNTEAEKEYSPSWYAGTNWRALGASGFVSSFGSSFSGALSSSSTAPGSSSGRGGSSGGGGGGGGGGGW